MKKSPSFKKKNINNNLFLSSIKITIEIIYWLGYPPFIVLNTISKTIAILFVPFFKIIKKKLKVIKHSPLKISQSFTILKYLPIPKITKKRLLSCFFIFLSLFLLINLYLGVQFFRSLPSPTLLKTKPLPLTTKIYDRHGELLYKIYNQNNNRSLISLSHLPQYLIEATIAIEDKDFYQQGAISPSGIIRALKQNLKGEKLQGGSTITQQLVKNTLLSPERTLTRKIKELILAMQTEVIFSKNEILEMYFNVVSYGGTAYGIEEASQTYFGKHAVDLSLAESALLAGLPVAPTLYSPFGAYPHSAKTRQEEVLRRMREDGYISKKEELLAKKEKLNFIKPKTDIKAPHFVMFIKDQLVKKYGEKIVEEGGLSVTTSLDLKIQNFVQNEISQGVLNQQYLNVGNGSALVVNPQNGEIIAMVGSVDYFDIKKDGNVNVSLMPRQPGSAIKPINYATAFSLKKITSSSIISDSPVSYKIIDQPDYSPQNYDGSFRGNVTVRTALASSLNVPAVKILNSYGVDQMIQTGKSLGITSWDEKNRFGLSLTLGGGEVKMIDLISAYSVFADNGRKKNLVSILKIADSREKTIFDINQDKPSSREVLSPGVAFLISHILADNFARSPVFGFYSSLYFPNQTVSVKTGTTDSKKDNWTIGYTKNYLTAVWIGNNDSSPMSPYLESGRTGAAPIWRNIMDYLLKDQKKQPLTVPSDIIKVDICKNNGLLSCAGCPTISEYYLLGTQPTTHCQPLNPPSP